MSSLAPSISVAIIGGGLAGLTAAYELEKRGIKATLFEASNRLGGRAYTVKMGKSWDEGGGKGILDGGEAVEIKRLSQELNIPFGSYYWANKERIVNNGPITTFYEIADALKETLLFFMEDTTSKSVGEAIDLHLKDYPEARRLMRMRLTFYDGEDPDQLAFHYHKHTYLWMAEAVIQRQPRLNTKKEGEDYEFVYFKNGTQEFVEKLAAHVSSVFLGCELIDVEKKDGVYQLTFSNGTVVYAEKIILAVPLPILKKLSQQCSVFTPQFAEDCQLLGMGRNAKILIPLKRPYFEKLFGMGSDIGAFFNEEQTVLTVYFGGDSTNWKAETLDEKHALKARYRSELNTIFEDIQLEEDVKKWVFCNWVNEPFFQGSYSYFKAPDNRRAYKAVSYKDQVFMEIFAPIDDSLFICGEHATLEYIGTMEGAVESGVRVARVV